MSTTEHLLLPFLPGDVGSGLSPFPIVSNPRCIPLVAFEAFSTDSTIDSAAESINLVANLWMSCGLTDECLRLFPVLMREDEERALEMAGIGDRLDVDVLWMLLLLDRLVMEDPDARAF